MDVSALWTIGYEKASLGELIAALKKARIDIVLDVRELPNSRRAGFSKRMLAASLEEAGVGYRHIKALGTPKAGRDAAKAGDVATMRAIMEIKLSGEEAQAALAETAQIARGRRACLLCLEHDWRACHRALVAERLEAFGLQATHLAPQPAT
jgi:uncharacterized protein (DUF488 family)